MLTALVIVKNPTTHHRRHYRNPFTGGTSGVVKLVFGSAGGLLAAVYIPSVILAALGQPDSGLFSYALAIAATLVPAHLLKSMPDIAKGWLAGGGAGVVWRAVDDITGGSVLTVQSGGLSSFFTKPTRVPLPAGNVFANYTRPGGNLLTAGSLAEGGPAPAAIAASSKAGMKWVQM